MNHQPFETWLLDDKVLTPTEKRELDSHLRACKACSALAETGLALRSSRVVSPKLGFALRFEQRLAAQKALERKRRFWGVILFAGVGLGLISWIIAPYILNVAANPVQWIFTASSYFLFVFTSLRALGETLTVLARVLPDFLPPYAWMVFLSALAGMVLLWMVSIWRFARKPLGATA